LTQSRLAESVGVTKQHLGCIERGLSSPSFAVLDRLCAVLQTSAANLFLFTDHAPAASTSTRASQLVPGMVVRARGVWTMDLANGLQHWSSQLCALLGCDTPRSPSFHLFLHHLHRDDGHRFRRFYLTLTSGLLPAGLDCRVLRRDGAQRLVRLQPDLVQDQADRPSAAVVTVLDITEWWEIQDQLLLDMDKDTPLAN
jgi:DNA-binding XRE family transcriptional regulator